MDATILEVSDRGLYCRAGDFFIDPWRPVDRAVLTHAHADHAAAGCQRYLTTPQGCFPLRVRLGGQAVIDTLRLGESLSVGRARVSLHPAGHILGSAQVRVEVAGQVAVVSGDYKTGDDDATCAPFEPIRCHLFISESTFALPIYRWRPQAEVFDAINAWWRANRDQGRACLLYGYALGKAQRLLSGLDASIGPIVLHGSIATLTQAYRDAGVILPPTTRVSDYPPGFDYGKAGAIVLAPPSAHGTPWTRRFGETQSAFASGWMTIRGARRRRGVDRGFVLSDHADWPGLLEAIDATGAETVALTHGYAAVLARHLAQQGRNAVVLATAYRGEEGAVEPAYDQELDPAPPNNGVSVPSSIEIGSVVDQTGTEPDASRNPSPARSCRSARASIERPAGEGKIA